MAVVAPPWFEIPPAGYGGIESVVADLVNGLVQRGHEVTLVGAGRNRTRASRFVSAFEVPPSERLGLAIPEVLEAAAVADALRDVDVDLVHDHSLAGPLLACGRAAPTLVTVHGPATGEMGDYYRRLGSAVSLVAISAAQRRLNPGLNWAGTVHNATNVASFPFEARKDDYVLWLGRFCWDKGAHLAISAARAAGLRLVLAGKCSEPGERRYFARQVEPALGPDVEYVGEADAGLKRHLLAHARALVFPIQWEEPFGMVMIEALACGTPVVATARGSVPEIVVHGETGLVVDEVADLPGALRSVSDIDPVACRRHCAQRFDLDVMASGYERVYRQLLSGPTPRGRTAAPRAERDGRAAAVHRAAGAPVP
ncbi:glycosyltransferase [Knoellia sinensis KCTC 19936]|uniref:Glycosyltransferase n=1 Tax=Knoellia sinensis KCTC 19936 TaxID=1385520 RepID=A0A0A0J6Y7_9MICO|nr:glycosyltransferase [Knoellia sinensis KCTC 19936]